MLASFNSLESVNTLLHVFFWLGYGLGFLLLFFHLLLHLALVLGFLFSYFAGARHR